MTFHMTQQYTFCTSRPVFSLVVSLVDGILSTFLMHLFS